MVSAHKQLSVLALAALTAASLLLEPASAWVAPIFTRGNKFFFSDTGLEFRMKGMAYYPRPNDGELYNVNNYDWASDEHEAVWGPHLKLMTELGVNTIRLYSVNPTISHDKFMCACSEAGIYVLIGLAAPYGLFLMPSYVPLTDHVEPLLCGQMRKLRDYRR